MDRNENISVLFDKYLRNQITEEELKQLLYHFNVDEDQAGLDKLIAAEMAKQADIRGQEALIRSIDTNIQEKLFARTRPVGIIKRLLPYLAAAAILLLAVSITFYIFQKHDSAPNNLGHQPHDIAPGGDRATLTLANGKKVDLTSAKNGIVTTEAGTKVNKTSSGQIAYSGNAPSNTLLYNTIETPKGGQFAVFLPDGTKAWLDAASSITFPVAFAGKERPVKITGQVYFEVAHNAAKPFRVTVSNQMVEVLGTHFNIMAYPNEVAIKTTLLQGSIKVSSSNTSKIIKPGEEAIVKDGIQIRDADLDAAVAWKNGRTYFKDADIPTIMRSLSRWYNIEVVYRGEIHTELFTGGISRKSNLSSLLKILASGGIHAAIEGNKLIVTP